VATVRGYRWPRTTGAGFQRSTPPDDRESGSGLELAIVREMVHAMGGSVWAESAPGSGATLGVRTPRTWASAGEK